MKNIKKYKASEIAGKIIVCAILFLSYFLLPKYGFTWIGSKDFHLQNNILFMVSHANIFHLLCNLVFVVYLRPPFYLWSGIVISFLCSLLPEVNNEPIMGISGICLAILGARFGRRGKFKEMVKHLWIFFVATMLIPNVAFLFHLYTVLAGYAWGYTKETYRLWLTAKSL